MKKNIYIALSILLLLIGNAHAQGIPKKANTIVVQHVSFEEAVNQLLERGYSIESSNGNFHVATTHLRNINYDNIRILIRVKDSALYISGKLFIKDVGEVAIENKGMDKSPMKSSFKLLNDYALSFKKEVTYEVRQE